MKVQITMEKEVAEMTANVLKDRIEWLKANWTPSKMNERLQAALDAIREAKEVEDE